MIFILMEIIVMPKLFAETSRKLLILRLLNGKIITSSSLHFLDGLVGFLALQRYNVMGYDELDPTDHIPRTAKIYSMVLAQYRNLARQFPCTLRLLFNILATGGNLIIETVSYRFLRLIQLVPYNLSPCPFYGQFCGYCSPTILGPQALVMIITCVLLMFCNCTTLVYLEVAHNEHGRIVQGHLLRNSIRSWFFYVTGSYFL